MIIITKSPDSPLKPAPPCSIETSPSPGFAPTPLKELNPSLWREKLYPRRLIMGFQTLIYHSASRPRSPLDRLRSSTCGGDILCKKIERAICCRVITLPPVPERSCDT